MTFIEKNRRWINLLVPPDSRRRGWARWGYTQARRFNPRRWLQTPLGFLDRWAQQNPIFEDRYKPENFGATILYTDQPRLFPDYPLRAALSGPRTRRPVSLICTGKNEAQTVREWMACIFQQSRLPDELVIVDGGSNDGSPEILAELAQNSPVPIRVICQPGLNISQGRNLAIGQAQHEVIAATDFGCRAEKTWLENLVAPFELDPQIEMVAGWYIPQDRQGKPVLRSGWPTLAQVNPGEFIPSSRSVAFTRTVWQKAHGYPEWLTLTGEDTYFALELRRFAKRRAFVPTAMVRWLAPEGVSSYWRKIFYWSVGDGESGLNNWLYWGMARRILAFGTLAATGLILLLACIFTGWTPLWIVTALFGIAAAGLTGRVMRRAHLSLATFWVETGTKLAQVAGYIHGARRRALIDRRRFAQTEGVVFILAGVPLHDTGGGSRGAQIALELLRQNYTVVYINRFESYESVDLRIPIAHPNLFVSELSRFSWERFTQRFGALIPGKFLGALVEFPLAEFMPLIQKLRSENARIAYDLLDDWDSQLGSTWYQEKIEAEVIQAAHALIATAPVLAERLKKKTSRPVALLPNAVNLRLFEFACPYSRPPDLPQGNPIITYIGALWGEWFDWDLLTAVAAAYPQAAVMVIGDYRGQCPQNLPNLHFLGLKPQAALPAYLAFTNVSIIPWKENKITYATSPLKIYEYLAMHTPVVIPNLPLLKDLPCTYLSQDRPDFIQNIARALQNPLDTQALEAFIQANSWEYRVNQLIQWLKNPG